jgi:hypothetical protein
MIRNNYTQFVHEFIGNDGVTYYAVAAWDSQHNNWYRPLTKREIEANGNLFYGMYGSLPYLGGYTTRTAALRAARRMFGYLYDSKEEEK